MQAIQHNGTAITLTQEPYLGGGIIYLGGDRQYNGPHYQAAATDAEDNEYMVYWFAPEASEDGDESTACDWSNPDHIAGSK